MKNIKDFINESLSTAYNENNSLAEYLIINCDYKYIVKPLLDDNFDNVVHLNTNKGIDFTCSNNEYQNIGIIYNVLYRKYHKISVQPNLLNNNHFDLSKKGKDITYLAYIYNDKFCLVDINNIEIKNYSIDVSKLTPDMEFELSNEQKNIYNEVYDLYDSLSSNERNTKQFKKLEVFKEITNILS